ncbi:stage III sporulation protein AA [Clostridium sp. MSJ-8]|uniref:stage III sporulation protein AA n=1 Tax=Clostridium sp. MSJ-8 TaxID=2841510 RepID=UPI001C0EEF1E|nr:stage III sporulation protein AA [Clostridium sp. MSJ-8]MBU5487537.1 stage III sporulation protein AA [Clostridium sp. MSJ-8]
MLEEEIFKIFPQKLLKELAVYLDNSKLQEIRLKEGKYVILYLGEREIVNNYKVTRADIKFILQRISNYSLFAFEDEIKQGFITMKGGHRIGLAGECVMDGDDVRTIKNITSLNIRLCKQIIGCSKKVVPYIVEEGEVKNTLIISPPKCGKTTLLRDIVRDISQNYKKKVVVVDERSEIAACYEGVPQMTLGIRTDVLDNCIKSKGMIMAIRSLSPEVIVCDELGTDNDIAALMMAYNSGVKIITSIHGYGIDDLKNRRIFKDVIDNNILERIIILSNREGAGTIEGVYSNSQEDLDKWLKLF